MSSGSGRNINGDRPSAEMWPALEKMRGAEGGFTLIELMIVFLIIALFSSMVVPSVATALQRQGIQTTGQQLCETLNFAYLSAITRHRPAVVNLDTRRGLCWVSMTAPSFPWRETEEQPTAQMLSHMTLPEEMEVRVTREDSEGEPSLTPTQDWETITFGSDGMTQDTLIELTNPQGKGYVIEIQGATGEVRGKEVEQ